MGIIELILTGVGLSMDAFAVAVCKGLGMRRVQWGQALVIALFFGGFQALMPLVGWAAGSLFSSSIKAVDHWIAFGLLAFIGGKMLWDAFHEDGAGSCACGRDCASCPKRNTPACDDPVAAGTVAPPLDYRELTMMAVATSIDALAVGITFAFLGVNIWLAVAIIGVTTFALSFAGVAIGNQFGARFEKPATIAGGLVLILLGTKILLEHLTS
ncbi:manganese efflux pump MntP family protein [Adlercreutzia sp. R21]|uniref:manganese efflux pump MntP n=1 Tax=Adlercreutzia wanghongyangiae TaxID=3111451 RepID=UPI002DBF12EE|nr:manganese efflux pump MntP family protein [Adlercreutzia sp. R21]MEC4183714.1 manganese efflux pump MntP family protein [Adlercreutzia sp. R21]